MCKTDVLSFYESMDQFLLFEQIYAQFKNPVLRRYLWQVIHRSCEYGGDFWDITQGISHGCPLSPLLGALYLKSLDDVFSDREVFYIRYMDDILILTKTRWQNRKAVKKLNRCFDALKVKQHPDKTFIGQIDKGFDFLGYHFSRQPLPLVAITVRKHVERLQRLYEQQKQNKATDEQVASLLAEYVKRWQRWYTAGLQGLRTDLLYGAWKMQTRQLTPVRT